MSKFLEQYKGGLGPWGHFLSDRAVIVQAWKKAHEYIRRHNWYSDNLELDMSCINLEELCSKLENCFENGCESNYKPDPMRIVMAPKIANADDLWTITDNKVSPPHNFGLRPLAHLSMRDQTVNVMLMMCMANVIERRQKQPRRFNLAERSNIAVNYGNRLFCSWDLDHEDMTSLEDCDADEKGVFLWGNAETYDRYYRDYRYFITRPQDFLRQINDVIRCENPYVISLDLSKFYDRIDRRKLFEVIKKELAVANPDEQFYHALKCAMMWRWHKDDAKLAAEYQKEIGEQSNGWADGTCGLPQGLVTSGFLANIYLLAFDDSMRHLCENSEVVSFGERRIKFLDYCRYVDDMRLVVDVGNVAVENDSNFKNDFWQYFQMRLDVFDLGLRLNKEKIKIEKCPIETTYDEIAEEMNEAKMRSSAPLDEINAYELLKLNRDLWIETSQLEPENDPISMLSGIKRIRTVKDDTLERFAANNWRRAYRSLMLLLEDVDNDEGKEGANAVNLFDLPCSRNKLERLTNSFCDDILRKWLKDPSKVRILRIALDLRPDAIYAEFILEQLVKMMEMAEPSAVRRCACYIAAELYRAAVVETGFAYADPSSERHEAWLLYRKKMMSFVPRFATLDPPWFLSNQLVLFSLCMEGKRVPERNLLTRCSRIYKECAKVIVEGQARCSVSQIVLAYSMTGDSAVLVKYAAKITKAMHSKLNSNRNKLIGFIGLDKLEQYAVNTVKFAASEPHIATLENGKQYCLRDLAVCHVNPFKDEVALLRLGLALVSLLTQSSISSERFYTLYGIKVKCDDWRALSLPWKPVCLEVTCASPPLADDPTQFLFCPEKWEVGGLERLGQLGRILRAVFMSSDEFSIMKRSRLSVGEQAWKSQTPFFSVKSSWLKRRYGMFFDRSCMGGIHVAVSPWMADFMSALLQWPGSWCSSRFANMDIEGAKKFMEGRLQELAQCFGRASDTLILPVDVNLSKFMKLEQAELKQINIALVQGLFPNEASLRYRCIRYSKKMMRRARAHLSDLLQMLMRVFKTHSRECPDSGSLTLVVFPELAIYERDISLLKRFSDIQNCMVFCGLVYCEHPEDPRKLINAGVWLIPQRKDSKERRSFIELLQGKKYLAQNEKRIGGVVSYRPVQWVVRGVVDNKPLWTLSASICYDSTDIALAADLRDKVDAYIVSAFNKDVGTFDAMAEAMRYHMYGHTVIANCGIYGGSTIQAPYSKPYERIVVHSHGGMQAIVSIASVQLADFDGNVCDRRRSKDAPVPKKPPAGFRERTR